MSGMMGKQVRASLERFMEHVLMLPEWLEEYGEQLWLAVGAQRDERRLPDSSIERIADLDLSVLTDGELVALAGSVADLVALSMVLDGRRDDATMSSEWMAIASREEEALVEAKLGKGALDVGALIERIEAKRWDEEEYRQWSDIVDEVVREYRRKVG